MRWLAPSLLIVIWLGWGTHSYAQLTDEDEGGGGESAPSSASAPSKQSTDQAAAPPIPPVAVSAQTPQQAPLDAEKPNANVNPNAKPTPKGKQQQPKELGWGEHRVMGGHAFPLAAFVTTPFAASFLRIGAGVEAHRVPHFAKPLAFLGNAGDERVDLDTLSVTESVDFEVRLLNMLAVFGGAYGRVRAGVNAPTLLGNGGDYRYGGDAGLLLKVVRVGNFQLALRGRGGFYAGQQAGILGLFQDLSNIFQDALVRVQQMPMLDLNNTLALVNAAFTSATSELLTPLIGARYAASVNGALALNRYVGLQVMLGVSGDQTTYSPRLYDPTLGTTVGHDQTVRAFQGDGALALDFDASPLGVPLDIMAEYALGLIQSSQAPQSFSNQHLAALGLYYSGRADFQLGVVGYTLLGQPPLVGADGTVSGKPQDGGAQLVFHYIW